MEVAKQKNCKNDLVFKKISCKEDLKVIFDYYYNDLCVFAQKLVKRSDVAEEIVQDVFVHIWEKRKEIDYFTSIKSYLFTSTKNRSINYLKSQLNKANVNREFQEEQHSGHTETDADLHKLINKAIEKLPNKCRIIFSLSKFGGLTYKEISDDLGISVKTVENQMGVALKKIRSFVKQHGYILIISTLYIQ